MPPPRLRIQDVHIDQTFLNERCGLLHLKVVTESRLDNTYLDWLLQDEEQETASVSDNKTLGMHILYTKSGLLTALAICLGHHVLLIADIMKSQAGKRSFRPTLQTRLFSAIPGFRIAAFKAHWLVLALHNDMNISCSRVLDLLSLLPQNQNRNVVSMVKSLANTGARLELFDDADALRKAFDENLYEKSDNSTLAQQAWLAYYVASRPEVQEKLSRISLIDTSGFSKIELDTLAQNVQGLLLRDLAKSTEETIDVSSAAVVYRGTKATWEQDAYKKRLTNSRGKSVKATMRTPAGDVTLTSTIWKTQGKQATIQVENLDKFNAPNIQSVAIEGRPSSTRAEQQNSQAILDTLQQKAPLFNDHWIKRLFPALSDVHSQSKEDSENTEDERNYNGNYSQEPVEAGEWDTNYTSWFPESPTQDQESDAMQEEHTRATPGDNLWSFTADVEHLSLQPSSNNSLSEELASSPSSCTQDVLPAQQLMYSGNLNLSQTQVVLDMLDFDKDITVIQGPPGTGKTTVIAAYIFEILVHFNKACLVVAESNVAIKNVGEKLISVGIIDWVLLVSSDFMTGWHEHLYEKIPKANIIASKDLRSALPTQIILCTLSMLSNAKFNSVTEHLHFESVIIEEASQIPMSNYFSIFKKPFMKHLKKVIFIGDDKQLPPFASNDTQVLDSVFKNRSLLESLDILLLNIQYRMPPIIGDFISREVYSNHLISYKEHSVQKPQAVQFLNVQGEEEPDELTSFKNSLEASAVLQIARILHQSYKSFKIITPYESQRNLLEKLLKQSDLVWANTCFTVDSFQGNEEDFIIISVVRTKSVGFLFDFRRSNVMLSRARRGMFICTNRSFLQSGAAKHTLLGKLADEMVEVEGGWIEDVENLTEQLYIS